MKKIIFVFILLLPLISFGKYDYGFMNEFYFGRMTSARAEAMGKSYCSIDGDLTTLYYNPAGTATIYGLEMDYSNASPFYLLKNAKYDFISVGYKVNKYLILGFSRNNFNFGQGIELYDINSGNVVGYSEHPYTTNYTITCSSQPFKNLFFGLNINYLKWNPIIIESSNINFDFGFIKKIQFNQKAKINHSVNVGASITNFTVSKLSYTFHESELTANLPVITRFGTNYEVVFDTHKLIDTLKTYRFILQGEFQKLINSEYESAVRTGCELMILEIISIRAGYYYEKKYDYGNSSTNYSKLNEWTYGFGLQIPFYKLTNLPLNINFDFTSLKQPSFSKDYPNWDNFTTLNLRLNWIFKNKK